ncbi:hypothetical protein [Bythopirellula goksoeyrii]|uniref:hypothetical protein n=1 Tax=Bythopirellula goksoeyrii TaxID=1400387 RepID=UPI0011CEBE6B|nr:hypothetical protein [Bythopirellula goksoeyrii]
MKETLIRVVLFLTFLASCEFETQAAIIITRVETTGYASALSGLGYQDWNEMAIGNFEEVFGDYSAYAMAHSDIDPGGDHNASSLGSLSYDELNSAFLLSGTAAADSPTKQLYTSSSSRIEIDLTLDNSYSFSLSGSSSNPQVPFVGLTLLPDVANERYYVGDSGTIGPGNYRLQGYVSVSALVEDASESDWYSATLLFSAVPSDADFDDDGDVDGHDFLVWQTNYGVSTDGDDLLTWHSQYGTNVPPYTASTAVPEPNTLILLLGILVPVLRR